MGQVGGLLRLHRPAAPPGPRPHAAGLAAAGADARPGRGRRPGRDQGGRDLQRQRHRVGRRRRPAGRRRRRRAAGLPGAADQPAFPRRAVARPGPPVRPAGGRRGALRLRLGPRLPARLPAHPRAAGPPARGHPGAGHHRDRQRARGRRRRRAAGRRRGRGHHRPRSAGPRLPAAGGAPAAHRPRPAGLAGRAPGGPAGQRHRLHAHRRRRRGDRGPAARRRPRGPRLHRPPRRRRPQGRRGGPPGEPGEGAGRHLGAGHGFRQARPRLRRPPRGPELPGQLLPAGRPRRPRRRARRRAAAARARGPRHLAVVRHLVDAARGPRRRRADGDGRRKAWSAARLETVADVRRSRLELLLKVLSVDGAVERVQGGCATPGPVGLRRRPVRPGHPHPRGRAAVDDRLRPAGRRGAVPHGVPAGGARRPDCRPLRSLRRVRRPLVRHRRAGRRRRGGQRTPGPPGVELPPRAQWPTGADRLGVEVKGKIAPGDQVLPGRRWPG